MGIVKTLRQERLTGPDPKDCMCSAMGGHLDSLIKVKPRKDTTDYRIEILLWQAGDWGKEIS